MTQSTKPPQPTPYLSFLLRIWLSDGESGDGNQRHTFVLQEISSGKRFGFRSPAGLVTFLNEQSLESADA